MEYTWIWWKLCLLICIGITHAQEELFFEKPNNNAVIAGQSVTLYCKPNSVQSVAWEFGTLGKITRDIKIYNVTPLANFSVHRDKDTHEYHLILNATTVHNAGIYICIEDIPNGKAAAAVIILEAAPTCTVSRNLTDMVEDELFSVECSVKYKGLWDPHMVCVDLNEPGSNMEVQNINKESGSYLKAGFSMTANTDNHGHRYSCSLSFSHPPDGVFPSESPIVTYSKTAPTYIYTFKTDMLNVKFAPRNLQIPDLFTEYIPGQRVSCGADGRPAVHIRWINVNTTETEVSGRDLVITTEMEGNREYRCEVENTIRNVVYKVNKTISFLVRIPPTTVSTTPPTTSPTTIERTDGPGEVLSTGLSNSHIVGIVIGVLILIGIIFIVIYILLCRRAPSKGIGKEKLKPRGLDGVDQVRRQPPPAVPPKPVNPYDAAKPTNSDFAKPPIPADPPNQWSGDQLNPPMYDVALDDTPRSRKPVQVYDSLDYTDFRRV